MKFWGLSEGSANKRSARHMLQRAKSAAYKASACFLVLFALGYGWKQGVFSDAGFWVHEKIMASTTAMGFKVNDILVTGRQHITQEVLLNNLEIEQGTPIFAINLDETKTALEAISWVETADVTRRLPDKIVISITERTPVALWQYQKDISLIDKDGIVLKTKDLTTWENLPLVVGANAAENVTQIISFLNAEPVIASEITSAVRIGNRRWDLHLKNGLLIKMPENNVEFALRTVASEQQNSQLLDKAIKTIDMRIPEKMVVEVVPEALSDKKENKNI